MLLHQGLGRCLVAPSKEPHHCSPQSKFANKAARNTCSPWASTTAHKSCMAAPIPTNQLRAYPEARGAKRRSCSRHRATASTHKTEYVARSEEQGSHDVPVTLVYGFGGAGKTSLLRHMLANSSGDAGLGALVLGPQGINRLQHGQNTSSTSLPSQQSDQLGSHAEGAEDAAGGSGSYSSSSQGAGQSMFELVQGLAAADPSCRSLIVECPGTSVPLPDAIQFLDELEQSEKRERVPRLDTLVTVVDAQTFLPQIHASEYLADLGLSEDELDDRTVADVLVEQVEYADVLVINKADTVSSAQARQLELILRKLNRSAEILQAVHGRVQASLLLGTRSFSFADLEQAPGWQAELNTFFEQGRQPHHHRSNECEEASEEADHGISSFVYYAQRPFHPKRLMDQALSMEWQGVLRSKGFFWLASRHDIMGAWQTAGTAWQGEPNALWEAARPSEERTGDNSTMQPWHEQWGDRCQQIAWIGMDMDEEQVRAMLDSCLLEDSEMVGGPEAWAQMEDPLPSWFED
ncbi:cobalamin synthesis protein cobW C-terminal domain-containing protein [Dunaliella salina]|uniref:Cobalamin synthesis protein cobW C-terminal domain-containing protein n=1 Tax=Dunaliella salina TaxID=3046 RepID=A0ABQ7G090_DUNSA|nr:cobalamin synthesis protein cobW C-terminal domain-containing protein [Dunaliella salina]|eukprot:KAF5828030.1 cobalamin synthesis protein cobW C-terminal domain-containing protein [Dunaliella salina]